MGRFGGLGLTKVLEGQSKGCRDCRQLRIGYKGGIYHVINRGNCRSDLFETEGAKEVLLARILERAS
jgi:hypothetical protein